VKRVVFHVEAEAELISAAARYETHRSGLGLEFIAEVERATRALVSYPKIGHRFSRRLRRVLVRRFPYGLLYRIDATRFASLPLRTCGGDQGTGVTGEPPNSRVQRPALRAAAEAPGR